MERIALLRAAALLLPLAAAGGAHADITLEGTVALPPARAAAVNTRYQQIAGQVVAPDAPAAIVYVAGSGGTPAPATVAQQGYQFSPGLMAVQAGATVTFQNKDDDYHHVFSYSKTQSFDLGRYRMDEAAPTVTFATPGTVIVGCEIHDHMRGTILVLETPHFTKTAPDGTYRLVLPDALAGTLTVTAWLSDRKVHEATVEAAAGATVHADFPPP